MISKYNKAFTLLELLVVIAIIGILSTVIIIGINSSRLHTRDSVRISNLRQISYALELYNLEYGKYPPCLYPTGTCTALMSLEGTEFMKIVPTDPLTDIGYAYFGLGPGATCIGYHLGASLENKNNPALLSGADAPKQLNSSKCTGSVNDFSGLSYQNGGQKCNGTAGTPQPTPNTDGETCYDLASY